MMELFARLDAMSAFEFCAVMFAALFALSGIWILFEVRKAPRYDPKVRHIRRVHPMGPRLLDGRRAPTRRVRR